MQDEITAAKHAVDRATATKPVLRAAVAALDRTVAVTHFERKNFVVSLNRSLAQLRRRPTKA